MKTPVQSCEKCGRPVVLKTDGGYHFSASTAGLNWDKETVKGRCIACNTTYQWTFCLTSRQPASIMIS